VNLTFITLPVDLSGKLFSLASIINITSDWG